LRGGSNSTEAGNSSWRLSYVFGRYSSYSRGTRQSQSTTQMRSSGVGEQQTVASASSAGLAGKNVAGALAHQYPFVRPGCDQKPHRCRRDTQTHPSHIRVPLVERSRGPIREKYSPMRRPARSRKVKKCVWLYRVEVLPWTRQGDISPILMKPRRAAALPDGHSCQRPECSNRGKLRSMKQAGFTRKAFLCDDRFGRLPAHQLNELFVRFCGGNSG
jgi:hypothetical protein